MLSRKELEVLLSKSKEDVCQYCTEECFIVKKVKDFYDDLEQLPSSSSEFQDFKSCDQRCYEKKLEQHNHCRINQVIDHLFDSRQNYSAEKQIEWIKRLICGRRSPDDFIKEVKEYDRTSKCSMIWTNNFVAYRCRTCAISSCMSLCAECFLNGDHKNHNFNMFRSEAGGACDCGDPFVIKQSGFCKNHQPRNSSIDKPKIPPPSLSCMAQEMIPRLLHYLILYFREVNFVGNDKATALLNDVLIYLCDFGTLMQDIICKSLITPSVYQDNFKYETSSKKSDLAHQQRLKNSSENYKKILKEFDLKSIFKNIPLSSESSSSENEEASSAPIKISHLPIVEQIRSFDPILKHQTYLDEIIFWATIYEYPANLIQFLLKMLSNDDYKQHFAEQFVKHYFRIAMIIFYPIDRFRKKSNKDIYHDKLATAMIHISIQLFSNEDLAQNLCEKSHLLYLMIISLQFAICGNGKNFKGILKLESQINGRNSVNRSNHMVVDCNHTILRNHRFWPLISDLNNLFAHKKIAFIFLQDDNLIEIWLEFITAFQAMNLNLRSTIADETNQNFKCSFMAELEICSSQMWTLTSHLNDPKESRDLVVNFCRKTLVAIERWLEDISFKIDYLDLERCTFHLPLHRYFSIFMKQAICVHNMPIEELLPRNRDRLLKIMAHPAQTLMATYQIISNLWHHFGPNIKTQALNYIQLNFCNSTVDADLFLVQQIATQLDVDNFFEMLFRIYGLQDQMCINPILNNRIENSKQSDFLENAFEFFTTLIVVNQKFGLCHSDVTRKEMIALLAVSDKTHSQIHNTMPYRFGLMHDDNFTNILNAIAEYKSPEVAHNGVLVQGYFYPKNDIWLNEYDPLFVLYRNWHRKDFQASLDRFITAAKQCGYYVKNELPWPPYRIPKNDENDQLNITDPKKLLRSKILFASIYIIIYQFLHDNQSITHHLIANLIYLLELAVNFANKRFAQENCQIEVIDLENTPKIECVNEFDLQKWFKSNDILLNFITVIHRSEFDQGSKFNRSLFNSLFEYMISEKGIVIDEINDCNLSETITDDEDIEDFDANTDTNIDDSFNEDDEEVSRRGHRFSILNEFNKIEMNFGSDTSIDRQLLSNNSLDLHHEENDDDVGGGVDNLDDSKPSHSSNSKCLKYRVNIKESMLTLLLKLHSKLSNTEDSFQTDPISLQNYNLDVRIGDGPYFIGCLLKRFILILAERIRMMDENEDEQSSLQKVINFFDSLRQKIWPQSFKIPKNNPIRRNVNPSAITDIEMIDAEMQEKLERKRKAMERRQQIIDKFAMLQKEFLKNNQDIYTDHNDRDLNNETNSSSSPILSKTNEIIEQNNVDSFEVDEKIDLVEAASNGLQCLICKDFGPSTLKRPFVQLVLLQSSSILNTAFAYTLYDVIVDENLMDEKKTLKNLNKIPTKEEEFCRFIQRKRFAEYFEEKIHRLLGLFSIESTLNSINMGGCGGVHVQSCGHYMHMDCFQSYFISLTQNHHGNDLIEFSCPLCRKMANSFLPILPSNLSTISSSTSNACDVHRDVFAEITNHFANNNENNYKKFIEVNSEFLKVLSNSIENIVKTTELQYQHFPFLSSHQSFFSFLTSITRTNLEYDIIQWRQNSSINRNTSCIASLFKLISLNTKLKSPIDCSKIWAQITSYDERNDLFSKSNEKDVPLLLKDVSTLLLQCLYSLPLNMSKSNYLMIVKSLFNVNFVQAILMLSFLLSSDEKLEIRQNFNENSDKDKEKSEISDTSSSSLKLRTIQDYINLTISSIEIIDCESEIGINFVSNVYLMDCF
ncbi:hypothetical protein NH340_JMT08726 [Sarcoptes scabiei]|nr:hypothetical protein NH340_JMT08726 [Sarcoptes scabiei]